MAFSWAGAAEFLKEKREESLMREQWEMERKERLTNMLLPELMKRRAAVRELAKQKGAVLKKGSKLFGTEVATVLENMGVLGEVVGQYKGTEADQGWAKAVINRVTGFVDKLKSGSKEDQQKAVQLLTRASNYSEAKLGEQSDFLNEAIADGFLTMEEYEQLDIAPMGSPDYDGVIPDLGKPEVRTPTQLQNLAAELTAEFINEPTSLVVDNMGGVRLSSQKVDPRLARMIQQDIYKRLEDGQFELGISDAVDQVVRQTQDKQGTLSRIVDEYDYEGEIPDFGNPTVLPATPEETTTVTVQENMGKPPVTQPTAPEALPENVRQATSSGTSETAPIKSVRPISKEDAFGNDALEGDLEFEDAVNRLLERYPGMEKQELFRVIKKESGWDPTLVNSYGMAGFFQISPESAKRLGVTTEEIAMMSPAEQVELYGDYLEMWDYTPVTQPTAPEALPESGPGGFNMNVLEENEDRFKVR